MGTDLGLVIAMMATAISMIAVMCGLFLWNRAEARTDNRRALDLLDAIQKEMKDFHGRLCAIEERNKK